MEKTHWSYYEKSRIANLTTKENGIPKLKKKDWNALCKFNMSKDEK
jgi:hypothetical protein